MATPTDDPTMETCGDVSDPTMETIGVLSDVPMVSRSLPIGVVSTNFKVTRGFGGIVENAKVNVDRLYLRQIMTGCDATAVNKGVYDGPDPKAKLVANGHGMHTLAGKWSNWFTLVFVVERFKGSTLQVMGANDEDEENEWAIVGGTGEFAMARGIINRRVHRCNTITQELTIEFFCRMKEVVPASTKRGPWGGNNEGSLCEMEGKSQRLESVKINHGGTVNSIEFSYIDEVGRIRTAGIWGQTVGHDKNETIKFGPSEFVKQITGIGGSGGTKSVTKFKIITNHTTYGPFGVWDGTAPFTSNVPEDETVVGFFANIQTFVHSIGVYTI